jgi:hypothetical protein
LPLDAKESTINFPLNDAPMSQLIPKSEHHHFVFAALTFAFVVVLWAVLHDSYLIHVEPRHFTEYHRPLLPISNYYLLALQYGSIATFGPGLFFGFLAYFACRYGNKPKVQLSHALIGFIVLTLVVEVILLSLGSYSRNQVQQGQPPLYPEFLYPDLTLGIVYTQTVNISAYLLAPALGAAYLLCIYIGRQVHFARQH